MIYLRKVLDFIFFTNIFVAVATVSLTIETLLLLNIPVTFTPLMLVIFFATVCDYCFHNIVSKKTISEENSNGTHIWLLNNKNIFTGVFIFSCLGLFFFSCFIPLRVFFALVPVAIIALAYSLPVIRMKNKKITFKEIPGIKIFLVAISWSLVTVVLPLIYREKQILTPDVILLFIQRLLFVFSACMVFDIRDIRSDNEAGIKTLSVIIGEKRSLMLSNGTLLLFIAVVSLQNFILKSYGIFTIPLVLSAFFAIIIINSKKIKEQRYYYHAFLEGLPVLQLLLLFIAVLFQ